MLVNADEIATASPCLQQFLSGLLRVESSSARGTAVGLPAGPMMALLRTHPFCLLCFSCFGF